MVNQKIIGIDIDNTLFYCKSMIYNLGAKLKASISKRKLKFCEVANCNNPKVNPLLKCLFKFFNPNKYLEFPDAVETINRLYNEGYEIHIITSRPNINIFVVSTQEWLKKHDVKYHKLIVGCNNKPQYVYENNVNLLIDDAVNNCKGTEDVGSKSIVFKGALKNAKTESKKLAEASKYLSNVAFSFKVISEKIECMFGEENVKNSLNEYPIKELENLYF